MKFWTCGKSPRSGSRNAWTRIKNVNGDSRLTKFWIFFSARSKWFPVGCVWWQWTKPGYITMTRRQNVNQWSGGIASQSTSQKKIAGKDLTSRFWDQDDILLNDYIPKGQTINAEYCLSLLVQLKDILKEKRRGKLTKLVLFLHDNAPAHWTLATQKKLFQITHPLLRKWPCWTTTCSLDWKII